MRRTGSFVVIGIVALTSVAASPPQSGSGLGSNAGGSPPPRYGMGMAYDGARQEVVMFGGFDQFNDPLGDTWVWDGSWSPLDPPNSPGPRYGLKMTYDAARHEIVLFGGTDEDGLDLTDTWTWNGSDWHQEDPADSPSKVDGAAMAYDAARRRVILVVNEVDDDVLDTWAWDGAEWTELRPPRSPPVPRSDPGLAFHGPRDEVVLFGGKFICADLGCDARQDTWTWDGTTWRDRRPLSSPPERYLMGISSGKLVVLFGGTEEAVGGEGDLDDTWAWNGRTWMALTPTESPSARKDMGMTFDWARREVVLFGGVLNGTEFGDTWTFDGVTWTEA
jgi:hypothetical protein